MALEKVIDTYDKVDAFGLDRNCKFAPKAKSRPKLKRIKYWFIDKFHAQKHSKDCPCNPYYIPRIMKRLKGVNTSTSEQVWSWFRGYVTTLNHMNSRRHRFLVLHYVRRHNDLIKRGDTSHLYPFAAAKKAKASSKKASTSYHCTKKTKK